MRLRAEVVAASPRMPRFAEEGGRVDIQRDAIAGVHRDVICGALAEKAIAARGAVRRRVSKRGEPHESAYSLVGTPLNGHDQSPGSRRLISQARLCAQSKCLGIPAIHGPSGGGLNQQTRSHRSDKFSLFEHFVAFYGVHGARQQRQKLKITATPSAANCTREMTE